MGRWGEDFNFFFPLALEDEPESRTQPEPGRLERRVGGRIPPSPPSMGQGFWGRALPGPQALRFVWRGSGVRASPCKTRDFPPFCCRTRRDRRDP